MQGDAIYAEIPPDVIPILKPQLREKLIIFIGKFVVEKAKPRYKVVERMTGVSDPRGGGGE